MANVLVVEDELAVRLFLSEALQLAGHQVSTAADGAAGLRHILEGHYCDLVLSDVKMPGIDGKQMVELMREMGLVLPILLLTASPQSVLDLWRAGKVQSVLKKPVDLKELQDEVALALQMRLDRRCAPRMSWPVPVRLVCGDGREVRGVLADISAGGVRVNWDAPLDALTVAAAQQVVIDDPRLDGTELAVQPAHSLDQPQTGFTFRLRTPDDMARLGRVLSHIS